MGNYGGNSSGLGGGFFGSSSQGDSTNVKYVCLVGALEKNIIMGAGLDVYDIEPLPENHKLRFLPNALLLPHLGYVTKENYEVFYTQMAQNLLAFKEGKPIRVIQMLN